MIDHPRISNLTEDEKREYHDLVKIIQNITGVEYIMNRGDVMMDPECAPFRERVRHLLIINMEREEADDVKGATR